MIRRPPITTRTYTLFPHPTLFRPTSHNFLQCSRHNRLSLELDQFFQGRPISPNSCHGPPWPENTGYMLSLLGTVSPSRSIWCGANDGLNAATAWPANAEWSIPFPAGKVWQAPTLRAPGAQDNQAQPASGGAGWAYQRARIQRRAVNKAN